MVSGSFTAHFGIKKDTLLYKEIPPAYLMYSRQTDESLETSEQQWSEIHDDFVLNTSLSGIANVGSVIAETDLKKGCFNHIHCLFAESPDQSGVPREGGKYAVYYHKGPYCHVKSAYENMLSQIERSGHAPTGNAYEEYLIAETATKDENAYVTKIMVRIAPLRKICTFTDLL